MAVQIRERATTAGVCTGGAAKQQQPRRPSLFPLATSGRQTVQPEPEVEVETKVKKRTRNEIGSVRKRIISPALERTATKDSEKVEEDN